MKITADRNQLAESVARAAQGLPLHPDSPVRAGILLFVSDDHAHLTGGDEDVTFTARLPLLEGSAEPARRILPGKLLLEMTRYLPQQDVTLDISGSQVSFICGRSSFTLGARPGEEYPEWSAPPAPRCTLDGAELAAGLRRVAPAASDDQAGLTGILLSLSDGKLTLVATDKYKLGLVELAANGHPGTMLRTALLPAKAAERYARYCEGEARAGWDDCLVSLHSAGLLVTARQVAARRTPDGEVDFLKWEPLLQGERAWHACDTAELTRAVRMALLAAAPDAMGGRDARIALAFGNGEVVVTAGGATQAAGCAYDGEPVDLAVGGRNLLAGLQGCGNLVYLSFTASRKPLLLDSDGLRWLVQTRGETP